MRPLRHIATKLVNCIDALNRQIGRKLAWLALAMVLVQFTSVVLRYIFGIGSIQLQESIIYMHGILFMLAAAETLRQDGHVRIDIFYAAMTEKQRAWVNFLGASLFLLPVCILIAYASYDYVLLAWRFREGSRETSGIPAIFLLKSVIPIFAAQMALQALAIIIRMLDIIYPPMPQKSEKARS